MPSMEDQITAGASALDADIATLVAENQDLGAQIDALRARRKEINAAVAQLQARQGLSRALAQNPEIASALARAASGDAVAPGDVVEVKAADLVRLMARSLG